MFTQLNTAVETCFQFYFNPNRRIVEKDVNIRSLLIICLSLIFLRSSWLDLLFTLKKEQQYKVATTKKYKVYYHKALLLHERGKKKGKEVFFSPFVVQIFLSPTNVTTITNQCQKLVSLI